MDHKPSDYFLNVIDFFAVLLPGAALAAGFSAVADDHLFGAGIPRPEGEAARWFVFLFASYFLGHIVFGLGGEFDLLFDLVRKNLFPLASDRLYRHATALKNAHLGGARGAINTFQWAKTILLMHQPAVATEVHRLEADSKFFRSFAVVLIVFSIHYLVHQMWMHLLVSFLLLNLSLYRYGSRRWKALSIAYQSVIIAQSTHAEGETSASGSVISSPRRDPNMKELFAGLISQLSQYGPGSLQANDALAAINRPESARHLKLATAMAEKWLIINGQDPNLLPQQKKLFFKLMHAVITYGPENQKALQVLAEFDEPANAPFKETAILLCKVWLLAKDKDPDHFPPSAVPPSEPSAADLLMSGFADKPLPPPPADDPTPPTVSPPPTSSGWLGAGTLMTLGAALATALYDYYLTPEGNSYVRWLLDHLRVNTQGGLTGAIAVLGAVGGLLNGWLTKAGVVLPQRKLIDGGRFFLPGWLGNAATGALSSVLTVGIAGATNGQDGGSGVQAGGNLLTPLLALTSFITGLGGSRIVTGQGFINMLTTALGANLDRPAATPEQISAFKNASSIPEKVALATETISPGAVSTKPVSSRTLSQENLVGLLVLAVVTTLGALGIRSALGLPPSDSPDLLAPTFPLYLVDGQGHLKTFQHGRLTTIKARIKPVQLTLDAPIKEWDRSAWFRAAWLPPYDRNYAVEGGVYFDEDNLYVAADIRDPWPLRSKSKPELSLDGGWNGGSLQLRLLADNDPFAPVATTKTPIHLVLWQYESKGYLHIQTGTGLSDPKSLRKPIEAASAGFDCRFLLNNSAAPGYSVRCRIPWKRIGFAGIPHGRAIPFCWEVVWADPNGANWVGKLTEFFRPDEVRKSAFIDPNLDHIPGTRTYRDPSVWGEMVFPKSTSPSAKERQ